ncbi:MAG: c-type cytochrome [Acidobacteria bacterium]|nr:c-type cytochrome [Acidobacteriota bacterium]
MFLVRLIGLCLLLTASLAPAAASGQASGTQLPEGANREAVQRACSSCHNVQMFTGRRMSREQWGTTVSNMIGRGAKISDDEYDQIVSYLATAFPLNGEAGAATAPEKTAKTPRKPSMMDQVGPNDKQVVDEVAAARGKTVYIAQCITCHGTRARGGSRGADLVRSVVVLHDRYGSTIGPYLAQGHPKSKPVDLTKEQVEDLSHFLHQQVGDTLRSGPNNHPLDILVGDPKAGKLYFEGAGGCAKCHSATGDLAHVGSKYAPPALQQKVVFPENRVITKQGTASRQHSVRTITVTTPSGAAVTGMATNIDSFNVSLRDAEGRYYSFPRSPALKVEKHNPYAGHEALLDIYTDKDIHDVVSYLETLQ